MADPAELMPGMLVLQPAAMVRLPLTRDEQDQTIDWQAEDSGPRLKRKPCKVRPGKRRKVRPRGSGPSGEWTSEFGPPSLTLDVETSLTPLIHPCEDEDTVSEPHSLRTSEGADAPGESQSCASATTEEC